MRLSLLVLGLFVMFMSASAQGLGCNPGDFYDTTTGACVACPQNTYTNTFNASFCTHCPSDQFSPVESDHCTTTGEIFIEEVDISYAGEYEPIGSSYDLCSQWLSGNQCNPGSAEDSWSVCAADPNCGGVNCNTNSPSCSLRYIQLNGRNSMAGYNFYSKNAPAGYWFELHADSNLDGTTTIPPGDSSALCSMFVDKTTGQCTPPTLAAAQTMCTFDQNCGGINCQGACALRYQPLGRILQDPTSTAYLKK